MAVRRAGLRVEKPQFDPHVGRGDVLPVLALPQRSQYNVADGVRTAHLGILRHLCHRHDLHWSATRPALCLHHRFPVPAEGDAATGFRGEAEGYGEWNYSDG